MRCDRLHRVGRCGALWRAVVRVDVMCWVLLWRGGVLWRGATWMVAWRCALCCVASGCVADVTSWCCVVAVSFVVVWCVMLMCVVVRVVLWCGVAWCDMAPCDVACCGVLRRGGMARCDVLWRGVVRCVDVS